MSAVPRLPVPLLPPLFEVRLAPASIARLRDLSRHTVSLLLKVAHGILRGASGFPPLSSLGLAPAHQRLLAHHVPDAPRDLLVIGRLDVSTDGERFVSYELNGDQPGGLEYVSLAEDGLELPGGPGLPAGSPYETYLAAARHHFLRRTGRERPAGALLLGNGYHLLHRLHQALERFFDAPVGLSMTGDGCSFDGRRLWHQAPGAAPREVDLVFRSPRVNVYELVSRPFAAVREAWIAGRAVLVNPPHSRVPGCKALLPLLHDPEILARAGASDNERDAVATLIPEVIPVHDGTRARIVAERARFVLKAPLGGKGRDVHLGPEIDSSTWLALVDRACQAPGWTASAYCPPLRLPVLPEHGPRPEAPVPVSIDPFVTSGERLAVAGFLCRAVLPCTKDPAELAHVKLNLLGQSEYVDAAGTARPRVVGLGRVRSA